MSLTTFADLLERLVFSPGRNAKLALIEHWFETTPDPERGIGLAALTGELALRGAKPAMIRDLAASRTDPVLFALSYDYVGDLAETVSLIWPEPAPGSTPNAELTLMEVVEGLETTPRAALPDLVARWLDGLNPGARFALLKLVTGGLRVGVSGRLARVALAQWSKQPVEEIEEVWHGLAPPYEPLFAWLDGRTARPETGDALVFRPMMLAHPLPDEGWPSITPDAWRAEWKWDGIRAQVALGKGGPRLWSRTGEDVANAFPDVAAALSELPPAVLDGELLVLHDGVVAPFSDLQQRLNRKSVSPKLMREHPGWLRAYDMLFDGEEDLRALPFIERRARLEAWMARLRPNRMDLSPLVPFETPEELRELQKGARDASVEGLMLKRADSPYVAGRVTGLWWKAKRAPLTADCVLMYAQRGHGKRSSFYSDYTFGAWTEGEDGAPLLVPVGKAYSGYTDQELLWLDRWIRNNTTARFGPVREVEKQLVLEVAFDAVQASGRHRSGVAMRFPRILRIRTDKPAAEADRLETLQGFIV
ncbi:cisplatin damage response ATP-dependent DNA ligase [Acetobacteraceae bacterium H6797]|nr:cisplatin damage response ATP-dependent DNA ligase [Acetobacteraceae bacterium H6797]